LEIFLATVALEKNRWSTRVPSVRVSEYLPRIREAGFDGIELWENHSESVPADEREALGAIPVGIFNSYCDFTDAGADARSRALKACADFGSAGLKWNVGKEAERRGEFLRHAAAMARALPRGFRFLCECHPGTILEAPAEAKRFLDELEAATEGSAVRIGAIVHPFNIEEGALEAWFDALGARIDHAHVQPRDAKGRVLALKFDEARVRRRLAAMKARGFGGTWTIEFVEGTGQPGENPESLFRQAREDHDLLRAWWERP